MPNNRSRSTQAWFKLTEVAASLIEVPLLSRHVMPLAFYDSSVNAKNIEAVARTLSRYERG